MALKYIAGTLSSVGVYAIVPGLLQRAPSGRWELSARTVESVELVHVGKEYNYAKGGMGMFAGGAVAGPVGMLVGGMLPKAFKDDVVQFVIRFRNGEVAHFAGSRGDYKRALNSSYQGVAPAPTGQTSAPVTAMPRSQQSEVERLREEVEALRDGKEPARAAVASAPSPAPVPEEPQRSQEEVQAEMSAEFEARVRREMEGRGHSQLWLAGVAERKFVPPGPGWDSTPEKVRIRDSYNEKYRKEYQAALRVAKKAQEKVIRKSTMNLVARVKMLSEMEYEFTFRTRK